MNEVRVGGCIIRCWPDQRHVCTILPDGSEVPASPNHAEADVALAHELGEPSTWLLTLKHEVIHTAAAVAIGLEYSPVLWWVAHQTPIDEAKARMYAAEEALVLDIHRVMNGRPTLDLSPKRALGCYAMLPDIRALIAALMEEGTGNG